jgi:translation initiation factor 2B subunit (eIF-2B alpha/beta/delta family)
VEENQIVSPDLTAPAVAIAEDRDAGAAELLQRLLVLLDDAVRSGAPAALEVSRIVCAGQPTMAPLWHACAAAVLDEDEPGAFEHARRELARAPLTLARAASLAVRDLLQDAPTPSIITLSYSSSVVRALLDASIPVHVMCGEGRPRFEGRRTALALAERGLAVTLMTDAALTTRLDTSAAVIVGADAVAAEFWINKVGTHGLAAAAYRQGVPVYVVAGRTKGMPEVVARRWRQSSGPPAEVWPEADARVRLDNPYFEATPVELATLFLTDVGAVPPEDAGVLANRGTAAIERLLAKLD